MRTSIAYTLSLTALLACNTASAPDNAVAAAAPATVEADSTAGDTGNDTNCDVTLEGPGTARAGEPTHATLSLKATGKWKVNKEAPLKVSVTSPDAEVPRQKLGLDEASVLADKEVRLEVPFTPHTEGPTSLEVHAKFGVCDNDACDICKEKRAVETLVN